MFLEEDGDGERLAEALARCAERGIGVAVLKVGRLRGRRRAASAHTGAVAGDQRVFRALVAEAGAAWADDPHELLELARVLAEPRARPRGDGGLAILTCSGGDSSIAADEAARLGAELPGLAAATRERLGELLPDAATVGNPLDYTAMIWGDTDLLRRITVTVGDDPSIDQLLVLYDHPQGLAPEAAESWARSAPGSSPEPTRPGRHPGRLDPARPDRRSGERRAGRPRRARDRRAAEALACAQALRLPDADPGRLLEIAAAASRAARRPTRARAAPTAGWTRSTPRSCCGQPGSRCPREGRRQRG